jgi:hypothetical protein
MEHVHQPGRILEQNGIHRNKMEPQEQNDTSKEEILLTWKVTRTRIRLFGSIRRSTEPKSDPSVFKVVQIEPKSESSFSKVVQQLPC